MLKTIEKTLDRDSKLNELGGRADTLQENASVFKTTSTKLAKKMQRKANKIKAGPCCAVCCLASSIITTCLLNYSTDKDFLIAGAVFGGIAVLSFCAAVLLTCPSQVKSWIDDTKTSNLLPPAQTKC